MEGFTLKCNKCGREKILKTNNERDFNKGEIEIFAPHAYDYDCYGRIEIHCDCGNETEEY